MVGTWTTLEWHLLYPLSSFHLYLPFCSSPHLLTSPRLLSLLPSPHLLPTSLSFLIFLPLLTSLLLTSSPPRLSSHLSSPPHLPTFSPPLLSSPPHLPTSLLPPPPLLLSSPHLPSSPLPSHSRRYTSTLLKRVAAGGICYSVSRRCFISRTALPFKAEEYTDMTGGYTDIDTEYTNIVCKYTNFVTEYTNIVY